MRNLCLVDDDYDPNKCSHYILTSYLTGPVTSTVQVVYCFIQIHTLIFLKKNKTRSMSKNYSSSFGITSLNSLGGCGPTTAWWMMLSLHSNILFDRTSKETSSLLLFSNWNFDAYISFWIKFIKMKTLKLYQCLNTSTFYTLLNPPFKIPAIVAVTHSFQDPSH